MKMLVTGCAGFIGSHLTERLLADGHEVVGIDGMIDNYDAKIKERNLSHVRDHPRFTFHASLLQQGSWSEWLNGVDVVFHLAALPGVRTSWGDAFARYLEHNVTVTQQLLEACRFYPSVSKIVISSSSSVFGSMLGAKPGQSDPIAPLSPYGVTKAAMEMLCRVYVESYRLPIVLLRYFTVYGPRQRPDMAFHRFILQMLQNRSLTVYGNGRQTRDFTYVSDAVEANLLAARHGEPGDVFNIGGDREYSLLEVIELIGHFINRTPQLTFLPEQPGDSRRTRADITEAVRKLGYQPRIALEDGLRLQVADVREQYGLS